MNKNLRISKLSPIQVIGYSKWMNYEYQTTSLLDQIVLENLTSFEELISERNRTTISRHALRELDLGLNSFKKIRSLRFRENNDKYQLSQIKNAHITDVEILDFDQLDINWLENILNSAVFNFKVKSISYKKNSLRSLNDAILENILKINPQELYLSCFISLSVGIRVLSRYQKNMTLFFGWNPSSEYTLKFSNTFVHFKDENTSLKLYWKEIWFKFEDMEKDDIIFLDNNHICISSFEFMKIAYFEIIETNETDSESIISENSDIDSYWTIPLSALSEITLNINELLELLENSKNKKAVSTLSSFIKFTTKLQSKSESFMFDNVCKFVPIHWELELNWGIYSYWFCYINTK